jgi:Zn-dependent protease
MILVPLLSYFAFSGPGQGGWMFGWASAPYDLRWRMRYPQRAGLMALAGPGANLLLALLSFTLLVVGFQADVLAVPTDGFRLDRLAVAVEPGVWSGFATFFSILFSLNVVLCAFNLIPAPPLDGATAIGALLPPSAGRRWAELTLNPTVSMVSLLAAWFIFPRLVVGPALRWAVELLYSVA